MFESGCFPCESGRFFDVYEHEKKRLGVRIKTSKRLKRPCVSSKTSLRFDSNVLVF